jgi:hypothetical protein
METPSPPQRPMPPAHDPPPAPVPPVPGVPQPSPGVPEPGGEPPHDPPVFPEHNEVVSTHEAGVCRLADFELSLDEPRWRGPVATLREILFDESEVPG